MSPTNPDVRINRAFARRLSGFAEVLPVSVKGQRFCIDNLTVNVKFSTYTVSFEEIDDFRVYLAREGLVTEDSRHE